MFDLFRSRDKAVRIMLSLILGVVALSMVTYLIPGGGFGGSSSTDTNVIATVGDATITTTQAQRVISNMMRGRQLPPEILNVYAPQMINNLISDRALAYEARRLGFKASEAETAEAVRHALPQQLFKDGKLISKELYSQVLSEEGMTIEQFEAELSDQVIVNRLRDMIAAGVVISPREVEDEYRKRNEKAKIDYVVIPSSKYSAEAQVSDAEVKAYFDAHRNDYQAPEKKSLAVLVIDPANIQNQIQPTDTQLSTLYRMSAEKFRVPERVKVRHILLKSDASNDAQVKAKIEDLEKQLKSGADFADLAKKNSEDNQPAGGSAAKGGDLGWITRGQTVKEFEAAAFSLPVGQTSQPIKTTYGYHILQVMEKQPAHTIPFEEAKPDLITQYRNQKINDLLQADEDKAIGDLRKDPANPDKAATDSQAQIFNVASYGPGDPIPGVGVNKDLDTALISVKKGQISQPVVLPGNKIVIADVVNVIPAHPSPFEEVQSQIRTRLNGDKLQQVLKQKADELLAKVKAGDLKKAAKEMGLEVKSSDEFTHSGAVEGVGSATLFADAFTKPVNSVLNPIPAQGNMVVAQIVAHIEPNMAEFPTQSAGIRQELQNQKAREREELFTAGLQKRLEQEKVIKIHNEVVKQLLDTYSHS
jgi:peptidyl-prolyl cis-trans isomerase D